MVVGSRPRKIFVIIIAVMYIAVFALNWNRLHYGVETSDEVFYVAEAYIVANGAIPFTNNWIQTPGTAMLYSPLVKLFTVLSGGTEGIMLFMREAYLVYKLFVAAALTLILKRVFPPLLSLLIPLPYLAISPFSIDNFSYNTVSFSLLLVSCTLLYSALQEEEKYGGRLAFLGGIFMALTILAHPMQLFTALYVFILILIFEKKYFKSWSRICSFLVGGFLTAIAVAIYLAVVSGGVKPIVNGIKNIMLMPYWHFKNVGIIRQAGQMFAIMSLYHYLLILGFAAFAGIIIFDFLTKKRFKSVSGFLALALGFVVCLFSCVYYRDLNQNNDFLVTALNICYTLVLLILLYVTELKKSYSLCIFVFSPFCFYFLSNIISWQGIITRGYILFPSAMLSIALVYFALKSVRIPLLKLPNRNAVAYIGAIFFAAIICANYTAAYYGHVYGDVLLPQATYKVERGVYKGLYTSEKQGKGQEYLEDKIREVTNKQDKVLFMNRVPNAYLMTQAGHCSPTAWDLSMYNAYYNNLLEEGYDATDDFLFHEYFKAVGKEPDKIIYIKSTESRIPMTIHDENYKFNEYVWQYYTQSDASDSQYYSVVTFERNTGQSG